VTITAVHDCLAMAVPEDLASFMSRGNYVSLKDVPHTFFNTTFAQKQYQVGSIDCNSVI